MKELLCKGLVLFCGIAVVGLYHVRLVCAESYMLQLASKRTVVSSTHCHSQSRPSQHAELCCKIGELAALAQYPAPQKDPEHAKGVLVGLLKSSSVLIKYIDSILAHTTDIPPPSYLASIISTVLRI